MRRLLTAGALFGVAITTLVVGPGVPVAKAGAANCTDGWPTTTDVVTTGVYVAVETLVSPSYVFVGACVADKPLGTQSLLFSGFVGVHATRLSADTWRVWLECDGDGTTTGLVTVNCNATSVVTATPSTLPNVGLTLTSASTVESVNAGIAPTGANVATGDLVPVPGPAGTGVCFVRDTATGTCVVGVPKVSVLLFRDGANDTEVTLLGTSVFTDPGEKCVGLC